MVNLDSTLKQLQTQLTDPRIHRWLWSGAQGVRERLLKIDFDVLRNVVDKIPLINAIINARIDQVMPFCHYETDEQQQGFQIVIDDRYGKTEGSVVDSEVGQLAEFIEQTGFQFDPDREDDFMDYIQMMVRDLNVIDQISTEVQFNRVGEPVAFWALDGSTIVRVTDENQFAKNIRFVQQIETKIYNEYTADQLVFDYKNKRVDVRYRGYGYSLVEQCIDVITTLLFGYNYMRDQMIRDRVPKGFISVMGDAGKEQLDSIREYWYASMSGAGAQWNIPILPSGKDGVGIDFKTLGQSNKDMEYHKLMMFVSSLCAAVMGMDLAEIGIKTDDSQALIGENPAPRLQFSKSRGLESLLSFVEQHVNKLLRKVTTKYRFKFVGVEPEDQEKRMSILGKDVTIRRTINEIREDDGLEPIEDDYANVVLNAQAVQIYLNAKQTEAQEKMAEQGYGGDMNGYGNGDQEKYDGQNGSDDNDEKEDEIEKALFKSMAEKRPIKVTVE